MYMSDFFSWLLKLINQWQTWASGGGFGGLIVIVLFLFERLRRWTMPKLWYILFFIAFFMVGASFIVWRQEFHKRTDLERRLEEENQPKLKARITFEVVTSVGINNKDSLLALWVEILNTGAPSIAKDFKVSIKYHQKQFEGTIIKFSGNQKEITFTGKTEQETVVWNTVDFLPDKAKSQPVPQGGAVEGYLILLVKDIKQSEIIKDSEFVVSFLDVTEKLITTSGRFSGKPAHFVGPEDLKQY
jgi:hypothetical protein